MSNFRCKHICFDLEGYQKGYFHFHVEGKAYRLFKMSMLFQQIQTQQTERLSPPGERLQYTIDFVSGHKTTPSMVGS